MRARGFLAACRVGPTAAEVLSIDDVGVLPRVLPASYQQMDRTVDGVAYVRRDGLSVIVSVARELDGKRWLHVSCARAKQLPSWQDLRDLKDLFIGAERTALQVLPPANKHVNIHPFCLHLFSCLDGDVTPDFTGGGDTI